MNTGLLPLALLFSITLTANADNFQVFEPTQSATQVEQDNAAGRATAARLTSRYNRTDVNCGKLSQPAFLCTGIVLRGTRELAEGLRSYVPNAEAIKAGSSSFNFLRSDSNNIAMTNNYKSGFIFYPVLEPSNPSGKKPVEVLCYFPLDGNSNARNEQGCGVYPGYPQSASCTAQNPPISTGKEWFDKYLRDAGNSAQRCSFNVRDKLNEQAGPNFYQGLLAKRMVNDKYPVQDQPGSLKLANWEMKSTADALALPLEAFFYLAGEREADSLAQAKRNKTQFFRDSGLSIPVIRVTLPAVPTAASPLLGRATFTFREQDQR